MSRSGSKLDSFIIDLKPENKISKIILIFPSRKVRSINWLNVAIRAAANQDLFRRSLFSVSMNIFFPVLTNRKIANIERIEAVGIPYSKAI